MRGGKYLHCPLLFGTYENCNELLICCMVCRKTGEEDVRFNVLYNGICHSDLHNIKNEWGTATYPLLPGYVLILLDVEFFLAL